MLTTDSVVDELRRDILSGVFLPGERLIELQLSDRYTCGRAVIRAALVQLESEGLVDREPNRGAVVHRISIAEAIEITEARAVLESLIAARAALNATENDVADLSDIIGRMKQTVADEDAQAYSELNRLLHARLREISGHQVASDLVENLRNRGVQNQFRLAMMPGRQAISLEQHTEIVDAIRGREQDAAADAMSKHLGSVIDVLSQWGDAQ